MEDVLPLFPSECPPGPGVRHWVRPEKTRDLGEIGVVLQQVEVSRALSNEDQLTKQKQQFWP